MKLVLEMAEKMQEESISLNKKGKYHRATSAQIKIFDTLRGEKRSISSLSRKWVYQDKQPIKLFIS